MKYFGYYVLLLVIINIGSACGVQANSTRSDSLTVQQAIKLALENQPALKQVEAQVNAAEARGHQAASVKYPHADVEGSYHYVQPVSKFSLEPGEPALALEPNNHLDAHLAVQQLVYDFGKTKANIALARSKTLTAEQQMKVKKWTISYFTVQTYYSILYLQRQVEVEQQQLKTLKEDLKLAQRRLDNGSATKYDVLSIRVRIAEENNKRLDINNQKEKMKIQLRKLFGWPSGKAVLLHGNLSLTNKNPVVKPGEVSYSERPDYQVLQKQKKVAEGVFRLRKKGNHPVVTAGGTAGYKNGYIKNLDRPFANWSIGVNIKIPIFSGFETDYEEQQARAELESIKAQTLQLQRGIKSDVQKAYTDVETGLKKLSTSDLHIKQAKEQLRLAKLRYRKGVITNTDLLTSETALARARLQKVTAQYHILVNQYELQKAAGRKIWTGLDAVQ